jgi:hypothetical protein
VSTATIIDLELQFRTHPCRIRPRVDLPVGTETLLFDEDELPVRDLDRRVLANCWSTVLGATDCRMTYKWPTTTATTSTF